MTATTSAWALAEFRAMGHRCRVVAPNVELVDAARDAVDALERRWSRFLPDSEISRLNRHSGQPTIVSDETFGLVARAECARRLTEGAYNPLGLDRLRELGYEHPWGSAPPDRDVPVPPPSAPLPPDPIELDPVLSAVRLPAGTAFDPGGIGKGYAADLVAAELLRRGAARAQIELAGDVRLVGDEWDGGPWRVEVAGVATEAGHEPLHPPIAIEQATAPLVVVLPSGGGVATSGITRRAWRRAGQRLHHLIDPATGWPAETDLVAATVVAATTWFAEVLAKSAVVLGAARGADLLSRHGVTGVLRYADGRCTAVRPGTESPSPTTEGARVA